MKNYRQFAELLEQTTKCNVTIQIMRTNEHYHYQLDDRFGMSLGVLCVDKGGISFAPFVTHKTCQDSQFININHAVQFDDFAMILQGFYQCLKKCL